MSRAVIAALPLLALVASCQAKLLGGGGEDNLTVDAPSTKLDAPPVVVDTAMPDAPPIDARACAGGNAAATAPDGSCVVYFATPLTFADASAACVAFGSQLLIIKDAGVDATARMLAGALDVHIGLTDAATEMTFLWVDGSALTYANWYPGEPNNGGVDGEDCAIINGVRGGQWDDRPCTRQYPYLCRF